MAGLFYAIINIKRVEPMSQSCMTFATTCKGKGEHEYIAPKRRCMLSRRGTSGVPSFFSFHLAVSLLCMLDGEARIAIR